MKAQRKIAVLDLGSNSFHMLVAGLPGDGALVRVDSHKEMVRLGTTLGTGRIDDESWARAMDAVGRLVARARSSAPDRLVAIATSAIREARNGADFVAAARRLHDLDVEVLSGENEARLVYAGARSGLAPRAGRVVVADVGGGSVELAVGDGDRCTQVHSLPLGVLRLRTAFVPPDGYVSDPTAEAIAGAVRGVAAVALEAARKARPDVLVFTAGTARTVAALACSLGVGGAGRTMLTRDAVLRLRTVFSKFRPSHLPELGVEEQRADTIAVGAVVLQTIMEQIGVSAAVVSDRGVREGVVLREERRLTGVEVRPQAVA
jgi:exopolyphosphatase / guanosine-5'-triphosphate,3'-diphosphate pyrophosphatase